MMYEDVVRDFADRTRANLHAIESLNRSGANVYEATQLVNSMLGLLVFPRAEYVDRIPKTPLQDLARDGWPIPKVAAGFPQARHLRELVRYLRNAIAHFHVEFLEDGTGQIGPLRVWNTDPRTRRVTWKADLSLTDMRAIAERFTALLLEAGPQ